eukprot:snap_masked-scaffold_3-processed-gene-10.19-mRNA-1 protein AED:1.00 eAED:1.00 QI:0/0/0/0/1/1/2/0/166
MRLGEIFEEDENCTVPAIEVGGICNQTIFEHNERLLKSIRLFLLVEYSLLILLLIGILLKYLHKRQFFTKKERLSYVQKNRNKVFSMHILCLLFFSIGLGFHFVHVYFNWLLHFDFDSLEGRISVISWFLGSSFAFMGLLIFFGILKEVLGIAGFDSKQEKSLSYF